MSTVTAPTRATLATLAALGTVGALSVIGTVPTVPTVPGGRPRSLADRSRRIGARRVRRDRPGQGDRERHQCQLSHGDDHTGPRTLLTLMKHWFTHLLFGSCQLSVFAHMFWEILQMRFFLQEADCVLVFWLTLFTCWVPLMMVGLSTMFDGA
ncbi:hypothetical protein N5079_18395 [Planotetraspora sp. A-T 1434]|uniref:hypothetical protein n=1 Tax=Planotetraspora sp. A-T 1434 TaxID=2979219 RepID=UPI0021BE4EC5|nr:hypothetical protein [Planotetraspora sp. A-T 1434]MCT9932175.1 hypothetical protein [Planotetraspora sp. A-T 1434]